MVMHLLIRLGQQMQQSPQARRRSKQQERELTEIVIGYLTEHPEAMDTLDGIAEWWVARRKIRVDAEMLARALQELTRQGVLEQLGSERNPQYRLRTRRC
jgi:hypothetical protein